MEIAEQFYKGGNTSKNTNRTTAARSSHGRKHKGGASALPTNLEQGCASKCNINHAGHPINGTNGEKTYLVHGPGHYTNNWKVLKEYSEKYASQQPHKEKEACSAETKSPLWLSGSTVRHKSSTPWYPLMHLSQQRQKVKSKPKILRVKRMMQSPQRRDALMVLTS